MLRKSLCRYWENVCHSSIENNVYTLSDFIFVRNPSLSLIEAFWIAVESRLKFSLSCCICLITWSRCSMTFSISNCAFFPFQNHSLSCWVSYTLSSLSLSICVAKVVFIQDSGAIFLFFIKSSITLF